MPYVKLPKAVQDYAVGVQSVNQAIDNNNSMRDLYRARHANPSGFNTGNAGPIGTKTYGRHDDLAIARTVLELAVNTAAAVPFLEPVLNGPLAPQLFAQRITQGQWRIFLNTPRLFAAVALLKSTAAVDRKASCLVVYDPQRGPSVIVSTWEEDAGSWSTEDMSFSLVIWAQT